MTDARLALLSDARLPGDARILAMFVLEHGPGWHEVPHPHFRALLDGASDEKVRRLLRRLEDSGWLEVNTATGRRPPQYRVIEEPSGAPARVREVLVATARALLPHIHEGQTSRMPHTEEGQKRIPHTVVGETDALPHTHEGESSAPHTRGADGPYAPHGGGAEHRMPHTGVGQSYIEQEVPPPPPPPLEARVRALVESSEGLEPCRAELMAYLELGRTQNPEAYIRAVEGAIGEQREDLWRDQLGERLCEGRAEIIAGCLNEIAQGDEVGKYFPAPPGDFQNLATKIRYRVKSIAGGKHDARRNGAGRGPGHRRGPTAPVVPGPGPGAAVRGRRRRHVEG